MNEVVFLNIQFVTHTIRIAVKLFCTPPIAAVFSYSMIIVQ